ncbi:MAG: alkaline phosphatase [Synergistaceae bacterium]|jgi:alkaline phosphatase|nr:alkaline phosphatase [Synergistaceae bacterium]
MTVRKQDCGRRVVKLSVKILAAVLIAVICAGQAHAAAKYVFLFIGDGMGTAQRNAAEIFLAGKSAQSSQTAAPRESQLVMNSLPIAGEIGTDSLSGVTDSAAAGTALATGRKTKNGAVATDGAGVKYRSVAAIAHERGFKVGIVTSSFLEDATPAAFYAHSDSRTRRYEIGLQLPESGFEYFAGGGFSNPKGKDKKMRGLIDIAASKGYRVTSTRTGFDSLTPGGKCIAVSPKVRAGYMPWAIDADEADKNDISLAEFVKKGIYLLGGGSFFMMAEGGKIDLACHANDAASAIREVIAFDEAVKTALDFFLEHPDDTLIVVTSDHETGGMALSVIPDDSMAFYGAMSLQKGSYQRFEGSLPNPGKEGVGSFMARARDFFGDFDGLGEELSQRKSVRDAFAMTATPKKNRPVKSAPYKKLYGPYDPFTVAYMREMNAAAGVTWSTFYHTGKRVAVSAVGAGSESFAGSCENSEIFTKLLAALGIE